MPQVDLETLVSSVCAGGSDRKIACETLADDDLPASQLKPLKIPPPDFPPESIYLSKDAETDWLDQNAFYERKGSQKGNNNNNNPASNPNTGSQRVSLKPKSSVIGLPKPPKRCFSEAKNRRHQCRIARTLMFPKRIGSRGKKDPPLSEPSSPKVSCMGRVRSKRGSRRIQRQKSVRVNPVREKPDRVKKPGLLASFRSMFRTTGGCKDPSTAGGDVRNFRTRLPTGGESDSVRATGSSELIEPRKSVGSRRSFEGEPGLVSLGGMKRFTSGRRADLLVDV